MGKYIQTKLNQYITESADNELDYDEVLYKMKDHGWGDLNPEYMDDFEKSKFYSGTKDEDKYTEEFDKYMNAKSIGEI